MRQIHLCAWLLLTCSTFAACGGQEFSSGDALGASKDLPESGGGSTPPGGSGSDEALPGGSGSSNTPTASSGGRSGGRPDASGGATGGSGDSSGGTSSVAGSATSGQSGAAAAELECAGSAVTFRLLPASDLPGGYFCDTACGSGWLTITGGDGSTAFPISSACGIASCETCEALPCLAAACAPTPLAQEGAKLVWNGTYLAKDTCGQKLACQRQRCVAPGKYKAKACAAVSSTGGEPSATCAPKNTPVCTEVTFDFPSEETIDLVLKRD